LVRSCGLLRLLMSCGLLGLAFFDWPTVARFDGAGVAGLATPPVFGTCEFWASANVVDRRTSAVAAQRRFMAWLQQTRPSGKRTAARDVPPTLLNTCRPHKIFGGPIRFFAMPHKGSGMRAITLDEALKIIQGAFAEAKRREASPLSAVLLDAGGRMKAALKQDHCALLRFEVSYGKAYAALAHGRSSRMVLQKANEKPLF